MQTDDDCNVQGTETEQTKADEKPEFEGESKGETLHSDDIRVKTIDDANTTAMELQSETQTVNVSQRKDTCEDNVGKFIADVASIL